MTKEFEISDAEFERFRDFFYRKTGLFFADTKRYFVDKRLIDRIKATEHRSFRSYFTFLRFQVSGEELETLINAMTVNETYFFREDYQLKCMVDTVLDKVAKRKSNGHPIRIWSVPCSTGEEPYSIALFLLDSWPAINNVDVELVASDIDTRVLRECERGVYSTRSVQYLPDAVLKKYFKPLPNGCFQISDDLKASVDFRQVNLVVREQTRSFRDFDLVFCRNLLIYFDDISRREAIECLYDALNPGGFLFLGNSETLSRSSSLFTVRRFSNCVIYQKPV